MMESTVVYFEKGGQENTATTLQLARERIIALGVKKLVMASTTGATAAAAMEYFNDLPVQLIVVPHQHDFRKVNAFPPDLVKTLRAAGHEIHFGTMLFHTDKLYGSDIPIVMANLLRCFSQGVKVCFEIVLMATDAGLLASGEKVIAIAGTARGADTALVMQAASSRRLTGLRVNEILCKPLNPLNIEEIREKTAGEQPQ